MIGRAYRRIRRLFWTVDPRPAEVMSATTAALWGAGLLWPGHAFGHLAYLHLGSMAPEWLWAFWLLGLGAVQSWLVLWGQSRDTIGHEIVTGLSAATWALIAGSLTAVAPRDPAGLGYWAIGAAALWAFVRSGICERIEATRGGEDG